MVVNEHEVHVSLETARMLQKLGFNWNCRGVYIGNAFLDAYFNDVLNGTNYEKIHAPTLDITQRWLREVKGIRFYIVPKYHTNYNEFGEEIQESFAWYTGDCDDFDDFEACHIQGIKPGVKVNDEGIKEGIKKTYEEILEEGINKCLTLLLEG